MPLTRTAATLLAAALSALGACASAPEPEADAPPPPPPGEIVYRVLTDRFENADPSGDRGGIAGGRLDHGYDPVRTRFYHGGDLAGVAARLDYVQGLGATAIQISPVFTALPVAGPPGRESASYHGEWLTDLTRIDLHLGTMDDLAALADAAHERGMKLYVDAVLNGTADLNAYEECAADDCRYRGEAAYPYTTAGGAFADGINEGFAAPGPGQRPNHRALTDPRWAYTPVMPDPDPRAPEWLTEPTHYHQRGPATDRGEGLRRGDWPGQDDLFTEHPVVALGLISAYARLVDAGVDGFRVLDAEGLNAPFLAAFADAMARRAALEGRTALVWGEAETDDPGALARLTEAGGLPLVEDDAFAAAVADVLTGGPTARLEAVFRADPLYEGGEAAARQLPTHVSSLEGGRLARAVRRAYPDASADEVLERVRLGAVLLMTVRGTPILYMGDEQGFGGTGAASAQDMLPSRVPSYVEADLLGTDADASAANFDQDHPYYRFVAGLAALRQREPALSRGKHLTRLSRPGPGLYVFSRTLGFGEDGTEVVVAINTSDQRADAFVPVDPRSDTFTRLTPSYCASGVAARASYPVSVPPMGFTVCRSEWGAE